MISHFHLNFFFIEKILCLLGLLASGSCDHFIKIWNIKTGQLLKTLRGHSKCVTSIAFVKNGVLASGSDDNTIKLWNVNGDYWMPLKTFEGHSERVSSVAFDKNDVLASGSDDDTIRIWQI